MSGMMVNLPRETQSQSKGLRIGKNSMGRETMDDLVASRRGISKAGTEERAGACTAMGGYCEAHEWCNDPMNR